MLVRKHADDGTGDPIHDYGGRIYYVVVQGIPGKIMGPKDEIELSKHRLIRQT